MSVWSGRDDVTSRFRFCCGKRAVIGRGPQPNPVECACPHPVVFFFCVSLLCCRCFFWPAPTELPVRPGIPSFRRSMTMALIGASRPAGRRGSPSAVKTASQPWRRASFGRFDSPSTVQVPFLNPSAVQVTRRPHEKMSGRDTLPCARRPFRVRRKTTNGRPRKRTRTNKIIRPQD